MVDEAADTQTEEETGEEADKEGRQRSGIGFPYVPLEDAVGMATAIQEKAGSGMLSDDQLAPLLDLSHKSSGYRTPPDSAVDACR